MEMAVGMLGPIQRVINQIVPYVLRFTLAVQIILLSIMLLVEAKPPVSLLVPDAESLA